MKLIEAMITTTAMTVILIVSMSANAADDVLIRITSDLPFLEVMHDGKMVTIMRNQDEKHTVNPLY
ncbi:MAG: rhodanese-like domain-containing protein, partial [Candidatus Promineifilaceae bacterium]